MKKSKVFKDLQEVIDFSIAYPENKEGQSYDCNIVLKEEGKKFNAHSVSIYKRDVLFFCDKGCINYVIDTIGFNNYLNLINIDE